MVTDKPTIRDFSIVSPSTYVALYEGAQSQEAPMGGWMVQLANNHGRRDGILMLPSMRPYSIKMTLEILEALQRHDDRALMRRNGDPLPFFAREDEYFRETVEEEFKRQDDIYGGTIVSPVFSLRPQDGVHYRGRLISTEIDRKKGIITHLPVFGVNVDKRPLGKEDRYMSVGCLEEMTSRGMSLKRVLIKGVPDGYEGTVCLESKILHEDGHVIVARII